MWAKIRDALIKLLGGTTAAELDAIRVGYDVRECRLEAQLRRMKSCIHVVRVEASHTQLIHETLREDMREYITRDFSHRLADEIMPMVEISEKKEKYMPIYTISGTLRVYKED